MAIAKGNTVIHPTSNPIHIFRMGLGRIEAMGFPLVLRGGVRLPINKSLSFSFEYLHAFFTHLSSISFTGSESLTLIVAAVIPSIAAVIAIALFGAVLCCHIRLRVQLHKRQNVWQQRVAARDYPEYADVEPNLAGRQTIDTKQNVAYETAMQAIATEANAAYQVGMQGQSPEQQNSL